MHILLKLFVDLTMKMISMREQPVQSPYNRIQTLRLTYRNSTTKILNV